MVCRKSHLAWSAVVVIVMLAGAVLLGKRMESSSQTGRDPRAYQVDSGNISLNEGLRRAGIALPDCLHDDLRYALVNDSPFGYHYDIYLKLLSSEDCMNNFLAVNDMRGTFQETKIGGADAERSLTTRSRWMKRDIVSQMGWRINPDRRFQVFKVISANMYEIEALVQHVPNSLIVRTYVYATKVG